VEIREALFVKREAWKDEIRHYREWWIVDGRRAKPGMTNKELDYIIQEGEGYLIEFKERVSEVGRQ
jgi:hypothetical protein